MLPLIGFIALVLGSVLGIAGWIMGMLAARKVHGGWLLGVFLFFVLVFPVFAIKHWALARRPLLVFVAGLVLYVFGAFIALAGEQAP